MQLFNKKKEAKTDALYNIYSKVGTSKDRRLGTRIRYSEDNETVYETLYDNSSIAKKIVDIYAFESTREFIDLSNFEQNEKIKFEKEIERLDLKNVFFKTIHNSRLYGAGIILIVDDTPLEDLQLPLTKTSQIKNLLTFNKFELQASLEKDTDIKSSHFGMPLYYTIVKEGLSSAKIHYSRFLILQGEDISKTDFESNNYFNKSTLYRISQLIKDWQISYDLLPDIISKFNLLLLKMSGMVDLLDADASENGDCRKAQEIIESKIDTLNQRISSLSVGIIDKDDELSFINPNITGVTDLLNKLDKRLVVECDIAHTILLGESPNGSNSTGNSTTLDWYNKIRSFQENKLRPLLNRLFGLLNDYLKIKDIDFEFASLYQQSEKEIADTRKVIADTDNLYLSNGVLGAEEVRQSRFGGKVYSINTTLGDYDTNNPDEEDTEQEKNSEVENNESDISKVL